MVAIALLQVSALMAGAAVLFDRVARPRLPIYNLEMVGLPLPKRSGRTNEWKIALTTDVDMFNANFVHIDVHALSFDMFYASSSGAENGEQMLRHIGNVQDLQQHEKKPPPASTASNTDQPQGREKKPRRNLFKRGGSANSNSTAEAPPLPIWSIESRSNFTTTTSMLMSVNFGDLVRSLYQLLCRWWQNSGRLTVPMTGVAHIRAVTQYSKDDDGNSADKSEKTTATTAAVKSSHPLALKLPFTVSIICDNLIDTWRRQVKITGVECAMHNMASGWADLETATTAVREFALNRLPVNATGGVLNHPTMSWEQVLETIAWEESLQHP